VTQISGASSAPDFGPYVPPRPHSRAAVLALLRVALRGDGDLLSLLPANAYRVDVGPLGYSRRQILIVNQPDQVRRVLSDPEGIFPKSDLMVDALAPLIGDSIFVSSGETWRRQRRMIDPAFTMMRVNRAFPAMQEGAEACEQMLARHASDSTALSLDLAMGHLTADIICRTVFSTGLETAAAHDVFDAFTVFEQRVAQVEIRRLIMDRAWTNLPQRSYVLDACKTIRKHLGDLLDTHLGPQGEHFDDIAAAVVAARDDLTDTAFTREELIDQLGVLFLAGHETSASALTWAFFLLAMQPALVARMRAEIRSLAGEDKAITFEMTKQLPTIRNVFRETLRLYPPITFLPRVATEPTMIGARRVRRGALVMVAPWVLHRHARYWHDPHRFDPDRFLPEREAQLTAGTYIPFGLGPRVCAGAAFAQAEAVLLIARLFRRFDFHVLKPQAVRPAARLTTRPAQQIMVRVSRAAT